MNELPFTTLLYRYFFFGWLFKQVDGGTVFERAAVVRHNRQQARWLPVYVVRWLALGVVFYGLGSLLEIPLESPRMATWFYLLSAVAVSYTVTIGTAWVGITQRQQRM